MSNFVHAALDPKSKREFETALTQLSHLTGKPIEDILRQQGRLFALSASMATRRKGRTTKAKKDHEVDIALYVEAIYLNPLHVAKRISKKMGSGAGRRFWNYTRKGNLGKAQSILDAASIYNGRVEVSEWDNGKLHEEQRGRKRPTRRKVITKYSEVKRHIKNKQLRVGHMKSGWAVAAKQLGGTGGKNSIPAYVTRHAKKHSLGEGKVRGTGHKAFLTVSNDTESMTREGVPGVQKIWNIRIRAMEKLAETMINRKGRKITRKLRSASRIL